MAVLRLDAFFSSQSICSRSALRGLLKQGAVAVNGKTAASPSQKIDTDQDTVTLRRQVIAYKPYLYLMLNKPKGVVSATEDSRHKTVLDLVPPELRRSGLFPAGRLDKESEGFVLITDDGDFAHRMLAPGRHIKKRYEVELDGIPEEAGLRRLEEGVTLADGTLCRAVSVSLLSEQPPVAQVVLDEGKYHQIKRMFGVIGLGVNGLKRTHLGGLALDPALKPGECREILDKEREEILGKSH